MSIFCHVGILNIKFYWIQVKHCQAVLQRASYSFSNSDTHTDRARSNFCPSSFCLINLVCPQGWLKKQTSFFSPSPIVIISWQPAARWDRRPSFFFAAGRSKNLKTDSCETVSRWQKVILTSDFVIYDTHWSFSGTSAKCEKSPRKKGCKGPETLTPTPNIRIGHDSLNTDVSTTFRLQCKPVQLRQQAIWDSRLTVLMKKDYRSRICTRHATIWRIEIRRYVARCDCTSRFQVAGVPRTCLYSVPWNTQI